MEDDPQDHAVLQELRAAWGIASDAPVTVIGQLRERRLANDTPAYYLEELEHPETGVGLTYPPPVEPSPARAWVTSSEFSRLVRPNKAQFGSHWAIAQLQLSPRDQREWRGNPYECIVRNGTMRLLSEIPEQWNVSITGPEFARRISAAARAAIEEQIGQEQTRLSETILQSEERKKCVTALLDEEIAQTEARKKGVELELEAVQNTIRSEQLRLEELNIYILRETQIMEDRSRHLAQLLAEKGRLSTAAEKPAKWRRKSLPVLVGFPCSVGGRFLVPA